MSDGFHIIINQTSGSVSDIGIETLKTMIADSHIPVHKLQFLEGGEFFNAAQDLAHQDHPVLIGGGDGTIKGCADIFMKAGKAFGIIPLGTMNLLAKDLGLEQDLSKLLRSYADQYATDTIDACDVNGQTFLCCASIGTMPETAELREDLRDQDAQLIVPQLTVFALNQMARMKQNILKLVMDDKSVRLRTAALVVSNNQYGPQGEWTEDNFKRQSLKDGILGIYSAAPLSLWGRLRFLSRLRFGNWKSDPAVKEWSAKHLRIETKNAQELVSLDGETLEMTTPLHFKLHAEALKILLPSHVKGQ